MSAGKRPASRSPPESGRPAPLAASKAGVRRSNSPTPEPDWKNVKGKIDGHPRKHAYALLAAGHDSRTVHQEHGAVAINPEHLGPNLQKHSEAAFEYWRRTHQASDQTATSLQDYLQGRHQDLQNQLKPVQNGNFATPQIRAYVKGWPTDGSSSVSFQTGTTRTSHSLYIAPLRQLLLASRVSSSSSSSTATYLDLQDAKFGLELCKALFARDRTAAWYWQVRDASQKSHAEFMNDTFSWYLQKLADGRDSKGAPAWSSALLADGDIRDVLQHYKPLATVAKAGSEVLSALSSWIQKFCDDPNATALEPSIKDLPNIDYVLAQAGSIDVWMPQAAKEWKEKELVLPPTRALHSKRMLFMHLWHIFECRQENAAKELHLAISQAIKAVESRQVETPSAAIAASSIGKENSRLKIVYDFFYHICKDKNNSEMGAFNEIGDWTGHYHQYYKQKISPFRSKIQQGAASTSSRQQ